jgi:hypothetical protein
MRTNAIDDFRNNFFDKLIQEEKEKEREIKLLQTNCFHHFSIMGHIQNLYQERTCSKCGLTAIKSIKVWEGTKRCVVM